MNELSGRVALAIATVTLEPLLPCDMLMSAVSALPLSAARINVVNCSLFEGATKF